MVELLTPSEKRTRGYRTGEGTGRERLERETRDIKGRESLSNERKTSQSTPQFVCEFLVQFLKSE